MWSRAFPKWNTLNGTRFEIEATKHAGALTSVPNRAIRRGRYVMGMVSCRYRKVLRISRTCRK
jgi:hypothetical protein